MDERKPIGLGKVRALGPGEIIWDTKVVGFAARRQRSEAVTYMVVYRTAEGRQRWQKIGRHGSPWTPDDARAEALRILGEVAKDRDPAAENRAARKAATIAELCEVYHTDAVAGHVLVRGGKPKKPGTLAFDRGAIDAHIKPLLGEMKVGAVTREDVGRFMHSVATGATAIKKKGTRPRGRIVVRGGRGIASRVVGLLGAIFSYAVEHGMRSSNPCAKIRKYAEGKRERRLAEDEYAAFGRALRRARAEAVWPPAVACAQFLALTGWRRGEALTLRWADVDLVRRTATLGDTKTGRSVRPLSHSACDLLRDLPRVGDGSLVFPPARGDGTMAGFRRFWLRIAAKGELPGDVTPHVLRHSFASLAGDLGYSEPTIAALVGHKGRSVTSRYMHAADAVLLAAADAVARRTTELMGERQAEGKAGNVISFSDAEAAA